MSRAFIQLSKIGDILASLTIIHREWKKTGEKPNLIVSGKFASILDGVSYVNPIIYDGHWGDLKGAIKFVKKNFDEIVVLQTHGIDFNFEHLTPSFQIESYLRGGCIGQWDDLELVFDQRDKKRERILVNKNVKKGERFILVTDSSQSSQFQNSTELVSLLEEKFGSTHSIIKLSKIVCEKFYDFLGLYKKADALVTIDTAHLHLSKASEVPTFALAADGWRGSAFSDKFKFYMRYSEWSARKLKLIESIENCIAGISPPNPKLINVGRSNGYNLSVSETGSVYRYHGDDWKTKLMFRRVNSSIETQLEVEPSLKGFSIEDLRAFEYSGKLHGAYVVSAAIDGRFFSYMAFGEIVDEGGIAKIGHVQIKYPGNDFRGGLNKNFVPFVVGGKLYFIYGIKDESQIVLQVSESGEVLAEHKTPAPTWPNGTIRGGAVVAHEGSLLRFFHSRTEYPNKSFRYFIGASIMAAVAPFATTKISSGAIIAGNEQYFPNCRHWKPNVVFPLGATTKDGKFMLSIGVNDSRCAIIELEKSELKLGIL